MRERSLQAAALGLAILACAAPDQASAYCQMTTADTSQVGDAPCAGQGTPLVWDSGCLSYSIDYRGSSWMDFDDTASAIDASFATWSSAECGGGEHPNLVFKPTLESSVCRRAESNTTGNVNTIAFLDPWRDPCAEPGLGYDPRAFAVTKVWYNTSSGEIFGADMMINDAQAGRGKAGGPYENCPDEGCPAGSPGPVDLASIVTHEAGHFIGIGHSNVEGATMAPSLERTSVQNRTLAQDDIDAVCAVYPPGNLTPATCDPVPLGGLELNCETTASGAPIACDDPAKSPSSGGGGGCSATRTPAGGAPGGALLGALAGLMLLRRSRRSRRRAHG